LAWILKLTKMSWFDYA